MRRRGRERRRSPTHAPNPHPSRRVGGAPVGRADVVQVDEDVVARAQPSVLVFVAGPGDTEVAGGVRGPDPVVRDAGGRGTGVEVPVTSGDPLQDVLAGAGGGRADREATPRCAGGVLVDRVERSLAEGESGVDVAGAETFAQDAPLRPARRPSAVRIGPGGTQSAGEVRDVTRLAQGGDPSLSAFTRHQVDEALVGVLGEGHGPAVGDTIHPGAGRRGLDAGCAPRATPVRSSPPSSPSCARPRSRRRAPPSGCTRPAHSSCRRPGRPQGRRDCPRRDG